MTRLVLYLVGVALLASGLAWLADRPGTLAINWEGRLIETTVFRAVVLFSFLLAFSILAWSIARQLWQSPAAVGNFFNRRRQERGLDALSSGMIAIGAGDKSLATKYAVQARKALPNEPLTHLLRAQAAQLQGDRATSRRIFEAMLGTPDTEQLGLRGLYLEAEREGEMEAARQFASRALGLNPKLGWPIDALFDLQCKAADYAGALETLAIGRKHGHVERMDADRRRAVLLTAQAQDLEDENSAKALELASEAHNLAADLVPAAAIAGRQLASRGNTARAAKVIERTWKKSPHPELAVVYAFARPGDSPRDRLERIKRLGRSTPHSAEGPIAVATAAVDARSWDEAREALAPLLEGRLTQRVCTLMARIEGEQHKDTGRVREWLARAVNAPRDPVWTADGFVAERWGAISPVTGALDAFQWKVPVEAMAGAEAERALDKLEELVTLGTRVGTDPALGAAPGLGKDASGPLDRDDSVADALADAPVRTATVNTPAHPRSPAGTSEKSITIDISPRPAAAPTRLGPVTASPTPTAGRSVETRARAAVANGGGRPVSSPASPAPRGDAAAAVVGVAGTAATGHHRTESQPTRPPDDPGPDVLDAAEDERPIKTTPPKSGSRTA